MPKRFEPSSVKNKIKREELAHKNKKAKGQAKLQRRLALAKEEAKDPSAKKKRLAENVPRTLDNTRDFDPSFLTADPSSSHPSTLESSEPGPSTQTQDPTAESYTDISSDPFSSYFSSSSTADPSIPPKVLITTSAKATRVTYEFCEELVGIFPGAEFIRRPKKGRGFELGRIAGWAAGRGYGNLIVVNENMKKPNAITMVHLPDGPTAYFKLTSIALTKQIFGHARATAHNPELVLNNFVTRLGHTVGRMFQTFFPALPEFQGRQVVTLHNQRDFLFFRRHRYAFRTPEKVALQEIGPRFTLKLRSLKKGLPAVKALGEAPPALEFDNFDDVDEEMVAEEKAAAAADDGTGMEIGSGVVATAEIDGEDAEMGEGEEEEQAKEEEQAGKDKGKDTKRKPPKGEEFEWVWKPELEKTRKTFFL